MKYLLPLLVLAIMGVVGGLGYLRLKEPKVWNLILAMLSAPNGPVPAGSPKPELPIAPSVPSPSSPPVVLLPPTSPAPAKVFIAPDPLPSQQNWTWTVVGKDYHNVVVTKIEADCVHIRYDGGTGAINIADLNPDLQKLFHYDPELAAAAAKQKADALAQVETAEAPKIAALQPEEQARADAMEAERKATIQNEKAALNVAVAKDQKRQIENDIQQMLQTNAISFDPITGATVGTTYWLERYNKDIQAVQKWDQVITSGGKQD